MSVEEIKTYRCDMCGEVIDTKDDAVMRMCVLGSGCFYALAHVHYPQLDEGLQDGIEHISIDLCPECAERATNIRVEVVPTDGGRSCRYEYSWKGERE